MMEQSINNNENKIINKLKKRQYLHVPIPNLPLCKNVHAEKETFKSRLKTKSIDHSFRYLFTQKPENEKDSKNFMKTLTYNFINKKKTREMIATYSLNLDAKLKLQRKLKNNQEEWTKKERIRNSLCFENKNNKIASTENENKNQNQIENINFRNKTIMPSMSNSPNNFLIDSKKEIHSIINKKTNENVSIKKESEDNANSVLNEENKRNHIDPIKKQKLIERTAVKIYGHEKFDKGKIKQFFEIKTKSKEEFPKKKRKKKKKTNSMKIFLPSQISQTPKYENLVKERISSDLIPLWKFNTLSDNYELNDFEESEYDFHEIYRQNQENHQQWRKSIALDLALSRLNACKQEFLENERHIQRNHIFLSHISSKNGKELHEDDNFDEENEEIILNKEIENKEIGEISLDNPLKVSLPLIKKEKSFKKTKNSNSNENANVLQEIKAKNESGFYLKLAETIEGICKKEHREHKKILKNLKNENRVFANNINSLQKNFNKI